MVANLAIQIRDEPIQYRSGLPISQLSHEVQRLEDHMGDERVKSAAETGSSIPTDGWVLRERPHPPKELHSLFFQNRQKSFYTFIFSDFLSELAHPPYNTLD
jgi:hypothetical protein